MKFEKLLVDRKDLYEWLMSDPIKSFLEHGYSLRCSLLDTCGVPYNSDVWIKESNYAIWDITGISEYDLNHIKLGACGSITIRLDAIDFWYK